MAPKIQHRLWVGPPMPDLYAGWVDQWHQLHPDWTHVFWDESNIGTLHNQDLWDRAPEISPNAVEQFRSDVARYEILYEQGGVWLDIDFSPHRPIDPLMESGRPWVVSHAVRWVANGVMCFPPGHPVMAEAVERLPSSVARSRPDWGNTKKSGPQFFTPIVRRHRDVEVLSAATFLPYEYDELDQHGKVEGVFATHAWNNQRRKRGLNLWD